MKGAFPQSDSISMKKGDTVRGRTKFSTGLRRRSIYIGSPMRFAASWIALEDVQPGAGELFYHVGSQRMAEHLYFGKFKGLADAERAGADQDQLTKQNGVHVSRIEEQAKGMSLETRVLHA